jgi:hypothetical protein
VLIVTLVILTTVLISDLGAQAVRPSRAWVRPVPVVDHALAA